jgi:hypothetical protein
MNQPAMFKQVLPLTLVFQRWPLSRPGEFPANSLMGFSRWPMSDSAWRRKRMGEFGCGEKRHSYRRR